MSSRIMYETLEKGIAILREHFTVSELPAGKYETICVNPMMKFHVRRFEVETLGNLCIMAVNAGLMQMSTFVVTPFEKNMPMLSMDFMYIGGKRKAYVEVYELVENPSREDYRAVLASMQRMIDRFRDLEEEEYKPAWYDPILPVKTHKKGKRSQEVQFAQLFADSVETYAGEAAVMEPMTEEQKAVKRRITQQYCDDMVEKGGVSTTAFRKALGEDFTREFFGRVFFGPMSRQKDTLRGYSK